MTTQIKTSKEFFQIFSNRKGSNNQPYNNEKYTVSNDLYVRILKHKGGITENTLHSDPERKFIFVADNSLLESIIDIKSDEEMFQMVGLTKKYYDHKVKNGWKFELMVFKKNEILNPISSDWNGLKEIINSYPTKVKENFLKYFEELKSTKYEDFENSNSYFEIWKNGETSNKYLNLQRFLEKKNIELSDMRLFLYLELSLKELYNGNGYTIFENKEIGFKEYFIKNIPRSKLDQFCEIKPLNY